MLYYNHVRTILCAPITQHAHAGITHSDRTIAPATIMEMDAWRTNGSQALWHCGSEIKSETQLNRAIPVVAIPARIARWVPLAAL